MNIYFFYYRPEYLRGIPFDFNHFNEDYERFKKSNPSFYQAIDELYKDLIWTRDFTTLTQRKYKVSINFHSQYFIQDGIADGKRSVERKKDKNQTLDNRLSFSLLTTKGAILFPINNQKGDFIHIPNIYTKKPVKIIFPEDLESMKADLIFKNKKIKFSNLSNIIGSLENLNQKILLQIERQIPFILTT